MTRSICIWVAAGVVGLCLAARALADAAADYKSVFGDEERTVLASGSGAWVKFAAKLLDAAKGVSEQKDLQALCCEKAYEFGMKDSGGYSTAIDAMKLLADVAPDKKVQAQKKLLDACGLRFAKAARADRKRLGEELVELLVAAGDEQTAAGQLPNGLAFYRKALEASNSAGAGRTGEINDKIKQTTSAMEVEARIADLKKRFKDNPKNVAARTNLILAYLGEGDNPAEAAKLLSDELDEKFRTFVPLSGRPVEELEESPCWELANWYSEIATKVSTPAGKGVLLRKARACCERFLELHAEHDVARLKGTTLLEKFDKELGKAAIPTSRFAGPNLVMHLAFDRDEGAKVSDASGKGNHGTVHGAKWTPNGRSGGAFEFDGRQAYLQVPGDGALGIKDQLTLSAWVRIKEYGEGTPAIFCKGNTDRGTESYGLFVVFHGQQKFLVNWDGTPNGQREALLAPRVPRDTWAHFAAAIDGRTMRLYQNGKEQGSHPRSGNLVVTGSPLYIGKGEQSASAGPTFFNGIIDEVMIFNRGLSADEIARLYQQQSPKTP